MKQLVHAERDGGGATAQIGNGNEAAGVARAKHHNLLINIFESEKK